MPLAIVKPADHLSYTDSQLATNIAGGDRYALEALMRRYNQRLYRVARSITRNDADAEEIVQATFFLAYRNIKRFRAEASLVTWLVRIAINESKKRLRKNNRASKWIELQDEPAEDHKNPAIGAHVPLSNQPESLLMRAEIRRLIEHGIDQLPISFRTVFVLRTIEELSVEETAVCLGVPAATVRSRHFRACRQLRNTLSSAIGENMGDAFSFAGQRCDRIVSGVMTRLDKAGIK
jgi:RNA polymerase sigma-70 factor (ECF subfamily)